MEILKSSVKLQYNQISLEVVFFLIDVLFFHEINRNYVLPSYRLSLLISFLTYIKIVMSLVTYQRIDICFEIFVVFLCSMF